MIVKMGVRQSTGGSWAMIIVRVVTIQTKTDRYKKSAKIYVLPLDI